MGTYQVVRPDGSKYEVDAESLEEASGKLDKHLKEQAVSDAQKEFGEMGAGSKLFTAGTDVLRTGLDDLTFGGADKLVGKMTGQDEGLITHGIRGRMGGADIPGAVAAGVFGPGGIPAKAYKYGGPIVRGASEVAGGALSGAGQGILSALGHDQDPGEAAAPGAIAGFAGGLLGQAAKVANPVTKWWKGIDDSLPPPSTANVPGKTKAGVIPRKIESTAEKAQKAGGSQAKTIEEFRQLNTGKWPQAVQEGVDKIINPDIGTRFTRGAANFVDKFSHQGQVGAGLAMQDIAASLGLAAALPAASAGLKGISKQGTDEAVEALRRAMLGKPKYQGPLSPEMVDKLSRGTRRGGIRLLDNLDENN